MSTGTDPLVPAIRSTYAAFIGSGFALASWASRIPQVKQGLGLNPSQLGLMLLAIAAGSVISLPLAGTIVGRLGSRRTVTVASMLLGTGLAIVSVGYSVAAVALVVCGLFLLGMATGAWDVAMNVQASSNERHLGRSIMPRFHAGFSLGTVFGALVGALMVTIGVPVTWHLLAVAVIVFLGVPLAIRDFLPEDHPTDSATAPTPKGSRLAHWRETRTLLVGVFVFAFAFAEGTGNDWISIAVIEGHHAPAALGNIGYALFLAAMTIGRWTGPSLIDRFGRVGSSRSLAAVAVAGLILFVFAPSLALAYPGVALWGFGVSLGFPLGMSAGADEPAFAAARVSVIASIGYCAFLAGPPLVGFLGTHFSVLHALTAVAVLLTVAALIAGVIRPTGKPSPFGPAVLDRYPTESNL